MCVEHLITSEDEKILDLNTETVLQNAVQNVLRSRNFGMSGRQQFQENRATEMENGVIEYEGKSMPFWYTTFGDTPFGERSLWISMHGGGGAPEKVNTQQWENQKHLYTS